MVGERAHERRATYVWAWRFDYLRTIEEYRRTIFFPTPSCRTIVDSLRDFEFSIAWCKRTVVISLQRASDSLARIRTPAFLRVWKRKLNECSDPYKCTFACYLAFSFYYIFTQIFEYLKVSKQTQYNIILRYTQLSKYVMTIARSLDNTGYPLNVQTWFQSNPNVHGLSTNVLKTYVFQRTKYVKYVLNI